MSLILTHGTKTLTLRSPDFGNTYSIEARRISRKTRGLDMIVYRDPIWSRTQIQTFSFSYLKRADLEALIHFLNQSLGQNVQLTDHMNITWIGLIITPATSLVEAARFNHGFELQFQGVRT